MRTIRLLAVMAILLLPAISFGGERFDGNWLTKLSCPAKGNTEGYTWQFPAVIQGSNFRGEHGTADQPGYLSIEGAIGSDGNAKLTANGIVESRTYAGASLRTRVRVTATMSRPNSKRRPGQA